ncbi:hypothetical protein ACH4D4_04755 [Streptomyces pristinaespiralis]|uniref:hypothetical protein n=1 Tax=Streptomyces pristinaespiralis TaxID=38300 RepID=UPI0037A6724E
MSRIRLEYSRGQRRRVNAQSAANHVHTLLELGWNQAQISRRAGIAHRVIGSLKNGTYATISRATEQAVLSVPAGPPPADSPDTDATGTIRRIRALIAIGYPGAAIAHETGLHRDALNKIARAETPCVRVATATAVAKAYRRLSRNAGPSNRARLLARKKGWHGPLAWDDTTIDDPNAQPDIDDTEPTVLNRDELGAYRRQEIAHLASFGISEHEIAARLGMSPTYVRDILHYRYPASTKAAA